LIYAGANCSLDDSVSNYNLVMLRGFAISSLGLFIFFIFFFSWESLKFFFGVAEMFCKGIYHHDRSEIWLAGKMIWYNRATPSVPSVVSSGAFTASADRQVMEDLKWEQEETTDEESS